jgi:phage terminase large subunit
VTLALTHEYAPRGSAREALRCKAPEVLVSGPAGTGKSRACLEKMLLLALNNKDFRGLIVRKTRESLGSTALETWRKFVAAEAISTGVCKFYGGSHADPPHYRFRKNGAKIMIGGMDKPSKIMSSEYDEVYVQEATELTIDDWQAIITRLRNGAVSFQQVIADCNPDKPTHWLKERSEQGATVMLNSRHEENPLLFDDRGVVTERGAAYLAKLDSLTGVRYLRLRKGLWVAAEGLIYEDYDPAHHLLPNEVSKLDKWSIPKDWTRWWSVDFGFTNPFVLQCWAEDPDGRLYLYREIYHTKRLVEDHARQILSIVRDADGRWKEPKPRAIICDHDAEGRATLEKHLGMSTTPARKHKGAGASGPPHGLEAVQARFKRAGDGRARIFFMRDAVVERDQELADAKKPCSTIEEIPGYVWDSAVGKPPKESPVKEDDHGMDAKRYVVAYRDLRGRPNIRWL